MQRHLIHLALLLLMALPGLGCSAVDRESSVPFDPPLLSQDPTTIVVDLRDVQIPFEDPSTFPLGGFTGYQFAAGASELLFELESSGTARQAMALYGPRSASGNWGGAILERDGRIPTLSATISLDGGEYLLLIGTVSGQEQDAYVVRGSCLSGDCEANNVPCGLLDCTAECPLGYVLDESGCESCACVAECTNEFDCPGDETCSPDGQCIPPCLCNQPLDPVCGDDGVTYANECEAACGGVNIVSLEACATECPDIACDILCPEGFVVDSSGCPTCECKSVCEQCTNQYEPVCSSNADTFINGCLAECDGDIVAYPGQCRSECGIVSSCGQDCPDGFAMNADGCPTCECAGTSAPCEDPDLALPVCGANGATYPSACEADAAGIAIVYEGQCPGYTCRSEAGCPVGTLCVKPSGGANCILDETGSECLGVCVREQQCDEANGQFAGCAPGYACVNGMCETSCPCSEVYDPVCGVDGVTYDNACVASCAGVGLEKAGRCCQPLDGCTLECPNGYEMDGNQCAVCQCRAAPACNCTNVDSPVCVLTPDGQALTYQNRCWAECDGYLTSSDGACL